MGGGFSSPLRWVPSQDSDTTVWGLELGFRVYAPYRDIIVLGLGFRLRVQGLGTLGMYRDDTVGF